MHKRAFEELRDAAASASGDADALSAVAGRARAQLLALHPKRRLVPTRCGKGKVLVDKASVEQLLWALAIAATQADSREAKQQRNGFNRVDRAFKRAAEAASIAALDAFAAGTLDESWLRHLPPHIDPHSALLGTKVAGAASSSASSSSSAGRPQPRWTLRAAAEEAAAGPGSSASSGADDGPTVGRGCVVWIDDCPGCCVLPRWLSTEEQGAWLRRALTRYVDPPFERNIDADGSAPAAARARAEAGIAEPTVWERACAERSRGGEAAEVDAVLAELRRITWATVGLRYDWTARAYAGLARGEDGRPTLSGAKPGCSEPPAEIQDWARRVSERVGMPMRPEAGIVNLYHTSPARSDRASAVRPKAGSGNTMGGHKDDAELAVSKPVVSMSIGCTSVFLMGGLTRETEPVPILLRSGDVLVMGGDSRLCFHGVACVIPHTAPPAICDSWPAEAGQALAKEAVQTMRVNINTRQVFCE